MIKKVFAFFSLITLILFTLMPFFSKNVQSDEKHRYLELGEKYLHLNYSAIEEIIKRLTEDQKKLTNASAKVYQTKYFSFMNIPIESEGILRYLKDKQIIWEVHTPPKNVLLIEDENIKMYYPESKELFELKMPYQKHIHQFINQFGLGFYLDYSELKKDYLFEMIQNERHYILSLSPNNKYINKYIRLVKLWFRISDLSLEQSEIIDQGKNRIVNYFIWQDEVFDHSEDYSLRIPGDVVRKNIAMHEALRFMFGNEIPPF
jgi:outer membrane lipoprotein-sorting protein